MHPFNSITRRRKGRSCRFAASKSLASCAGVSFTGVPTTKTDMGRKGPGHEIAGVRPDCRVAAEFSPDSKELTALRALGFTAGGPAAVWARRAPATVGGAGQGSPLGLERGVSTSGCV